MSSSQVEEPVRLFEPFLTEFEKGVLPDHGCELITKNEVQRQSSTVVVGVDAVNV
jgi:hypothetical protein